MDKVRTKPTTIPTGKQRVCVEYLELKEIQKKIKGKKLIA